MLLKWYLDQLSVGDVALVKHCDIKIVLPVPNQCGSTIKQKLSLTLLTTFRCLMKTKLKQYQKFVLFPTWGIVGQKNYTFLVRFVMLHVYTLGVFPPIRGLVAGKASHRKTNAML